MKIKFKSVGSIRSYPESFVAVYQVYEYIRSLDAVVLTLYVPHRQNRVCDHMVAGQTL